MSVFVAAQGRTGAGTQAVREDGMPYQEDAPPPGVLAPVNQAEGAKAREGSADGTGASAGRLSEFLISLVALVMRPG